MFQLIVLNEDPENDNLQDDEADSCHESPESALHGYQLLLQVIKDPLIVVCGLPRNDPKNSLYNEGYRIDQDRKQLKGVQKFPILQIESSTQGKED